MDRITVPAFAEGEGEPQNVVQKNLNKMIEMVEDDRWIRDISDTRAVDGRARQRHCTQGLIMLVRNGGI